MGALFFGVGCFFLLAIAIGERDPGAPAWALVVGVAIPLIIALAGGWLLTRAVFWAGDEKR